MRVVPGTLAFTHNKRTVTSTRDVSELVQVGHTLVIGVSGPQVRVEDVTARWVHVSRAWGRGLILNATGRKLVLTRKFPHDTIRKAKVMVSKAPPSSEQQTTLATSKQMMQRAG